jgi:hypothetical protein
LLHPEAFPVCVATFVLMLAISHHPKTKTFCMASFLARKKTLATSQVSFFSLLESSSN